MEELKDNIQLFEDKKIRTAWDAKREEWYFSVVDVVDGKPQAEPFKLWLAQGYTAMLSLFLCKKRNCHREEICMM